MAKRLTAVFLMFGLTLSAVAFAHEEEAQDQGKAPSTPGVRAIPVSPSKTGQMEPTPEEVGKMMETMMGPMMGQMMASMVKTMAKTMAEPEIAQYFATFMRGYYLALVERGFTEEEAMRIVTSTRIPSMGGMQQ